MFRSRYLRQQPALRPVRAMTALLRTLLRLAPLCLLGACAGGGADGARTQPRLLRLEARDFTFATPAAVPAGLTRVRLVNRGAEWHEAGIARLPEGTSAEAYLAGARAGESFPVGAVDFGGPGKVATGDSSEVVLRLAPGRYAIVCWADGHVKRGMIATLIVTEPEPGAQRADTSAAPPSSDAVVALQDFRFVHAPGAFRSAPTVLHVRNEGRRPHDMTIYRLHPGRTLREFGAWYRSRQGAPPAVPAGGMNTLAPGREGWASLTLPPGRYFIACGTPEGETIHAAMGMIEEFEVR